MFAKSKKGGFTLIEILVVIGIIALLATIVIIAINPARQFAQARNTQRESNINTILNAIGQNIADNKGVFTCGTVTLPTASSSILMGAAGIPPAAPSSLYALAAGTVNLSCLTPIYVPQITSDPDAAWAAPAQNYTGYELSTDANGRVLICAPRALSETVISNPAPTICVKR